MSEKREGAPTRAAEKLVGAFGPTPEGPSTADLRRRAQLDSSGLWIIAYDDDGRLWAFPFRSSNSSP